MRVLRDFVVFPLAALALCACVYTKAVPIGGNTWVMETDGRGALGAEIASTRTLRSAAELALTEGYSYFLLREAPAGPTDIGFRALLYGSTRSVTYASDLEPPGLPPAPERPNNEPAVRTRVAVVMLRRGDPRIPEAYNALKVLAAYE